MIFELMLRTTEHPEPQVVLLDDYDWYRPRLTVIDSIDVLTEFKARKASWRKQHFVHLLSGRDHRRGRLAGRSTDQESITPATSCANGCSPAAPPPPTASNAAPARTGAAAAAHGKRLRSSRLNHRSQQ
jgi:hypothetical protein